jgi:hypothetical protein
MAPLARKIAIVRSAAAITVVLIICVAINIYMTSYQFGGGKVTATSSQHYYS